MVGFVGVAAVTGLLAGRSVEEGEGGKAPAAAERSEAAAERTQARYDRGVETALAELGQRREGPLARLRNARAPAEQAAALEALAGQHRQAARELRTLPRTAASGDSPAALRSALTAAAEGYERMARAAVQRERGTYEAATADVRASETRLQRAVRSLRSPS